MHLTYADINRTIIVTVL